MDGEGGSWANSVYRITNGKTQSLICILLNHVSSDKQRSREVNGNAQYKVPRWWSI